jgi:hypothetical protein
MIIFIKLSAHTGVGRELVRFWNTAPASSLEAGKGGHLCEYLDGAHVVNLLDRDEAACTEMTLKYIMMSVAKTTSHDGRKDIEY